MTELRTNILTVSGNYFDYVDVESNVVSVQDIAHGLSNECRFGSQCPRFYSVAQHSVMVAWIVEALGGDIIEQRQAIMHDASEAFMKDMPTPLKKLLPGYYEVEARVQKDLMRRLGLSHELSALIKQADLLALGIEKRDLYSNCDAWRVLQGIDFSDPRLADIYIVRALPS